MATEIVSIIYITLGLLGILTNVTFIHTVLVNKALWTPANYLLFSMSLVDVVHSVAFVSYGIISSQFVEDATWLDVNGYFTVADVIYYFTMASGVLHLTAVACERYVSILYPLRYCTIMSGKRVRVIAVACWLLPICGSSQILIAKSLINFEHSINCYAVCGISFNMILVNFIILAIVFLSNVVLYGSIFQTAVKQIRRISSGLPNHTERGSQNTLLKEVKAAAVSFATIVYYLFSYIPFGVLILYSMKIEHRALMDSVAIPLEFMAYAYPALNPIIYGLANKQIRQHLFKCKMFCMPCQK